MADGNIKLYGKLKSVTEEGKVADYSEIAEVPIIMQDLSASGFTPTANTYYLHIGETTITYNNGMIYFYNGSTYIQVGGGDLALENGTGDVLIQTTDPNQSFKIMTDGRAKVKSAPIESDDVVRKLELDTKLDKGLIPSKYLPSYVDDVVEYDSKNDFPKPGETGKIYVDKSTKLTYRWSGSTYIQVGGGDLALENGTGDVLIQTTDPNQSFKIMTDGRAKVYGEPTENDDVLRLNEFSVLTQSQVDLLF